jgi:hypothetical protein
MRSTAHALRDILNRHLRTFTTELKPERNSKLLVETADKNAFEHQQQASKQRKKATRAERGATADYPVTVNKGLDLQDALEKSISMKKKRHHRLSTT